MSAASDRNHVSRKRERRGENIVSDAARLDELAGGTPLPHGWAWTSLADIASIVGGVTKGQKFKPGVTTRLVPYLRVANVQRGFLDLSEVKTIQATEDDIAALKLQPGDVLFNEGGDRDKLGRGWVWEGQIPECIHQNHVFRARLLSCGINPRFLSYWGNTFGQQWFMRAGRQSVNLASINLSVLRRFPVPVAPPAEQARLVERLDELLSDVDAAAASLERARSKLGHYRAAVLKAAVAGKLVPGQPAAVEQELGTLVDTIYQGWSPKCEGMHSDDPEVWAVIKTTAVQPMRFLPSENKRLPSTSSPRPHLQLKEGDLLMTRAGPRARAGVTCMVRQSRPKLMLCDKTYLLRCDNSKVTPAFLEVCLNAPQILDAIDTLKTGISDSGVNLTQTRLKKLVLPLPAISEQQVIVEAVEDQLSVIDHLEADLDAKLQSAHALRQSILRHAFAGKLVPQDPTDEPAGELLKRIAAERERETAERRQKRPKSARNRTRASPPRMGLEG